jgi:type IV pilus assembly protein PilW
MLPTTRQIHRYAGALRGFTLVEVMVGVLIGMIAIIVIFQVFQVSDARKRTTSQGSDAQIAGTVAMFAVERDIRLAGYGFGPAASAAGGNLMGCDVLVYDNQNPSVNFNLKLAPVVITQGAGGASDTITVLWGNPVKFSHYETFALSTDTTKVLKYRNGFDRADLAVVGNGISCHLLEVTDNTNVDQKTINHVAGTYLLEDGVTQKITRYDNPLGPGGMTFPTGGRIFNLGAYPRANEWKVLNGKLVITDLLHYLDTNGDAVNDWVEIADGVIDLQAEYGYDGDGDGLVSDTEWTTATPAGTNWAKVLAIRVAILTRSAQYEQGYVAPNPAWGTATAGSCLPQQCFVMTNLDGTAGTSTPADPALSWKSYRYRVYEEVIPFRNVIWGAN